MKKMMNLKRLVKIEITNNENNLFRKKKQKNCPGN